MWKKEGSTTSTRNMEGKLLRISYEPFSSFSFHNLGSYLAYLEEKSIVIYPVICFISRKDMRKFSPRGGIFP